MSNLVLKLAETVRSLGVKTVYGEPVELDGVTLIPVAFVQFGFGGGSDGSAGEESAGDDSAGGGGGGGLSVPIGAYVRSGSTVRFEPNVIALLAVGIPFVCVAGRALARVIKALKR